MIFLLTIFLWIGSGFAEEKGLEVEPFLDPPSAEVVDQRTYELAKILRCPVCQGLSVADSRSDAAVAMKNRIEELVALGYSNEQIIDYFVERYGEFTLLRPKDEHRLVWLAPGVVFILGVLVVVFRMDRTRSSESRNGEQRTEDKKNAEEDEYRQRILAELGEE